MTEDPGYRRTPLDVEALRLEWQVFEMRYGVPSHDLKAAFTVEGRLLECDDFRRWKRIYRLLERRGLSR